MTRPETPAAGRFNPAGSPVQAGKFSLPVLQKRSDFQKAAKAARRSTASFNIQARKRGCDEGREGVFVGFTCSKKVGNAVARNRAKRRLREAARLVLPQYGVLGWDYVLIGRADATANHPFATMCADLKSALAVLHSRKT